MLTEHFTELGKHIRSIEIVYQGSTQLVLFPFFPVFNFYSGESKDKLMDNVNRDTQREKILGLLEESENIFAELEFYFYLS